MTLSQTISPSEAARLPASVTGSGDEVTEPGAQTVLIRIYGPHGGSISDLMIDGRRVGSSEQNVMTQRSSSDHRGCADLHPRRRRGDVDHGDRARGRPAT